MDDEGPLPAPLILGVRDVSGSLMEVRAIIFSLCRLLRSFLLRFSSALPTSSSLGLTLTSMGGAGTTAVKKESGRRDVDVLRGAVLGRRVLGLVASRTASLPLTGVGVGEREGKRSAPLPLGRGEVRAAPAAPGTRSALRKAVRPALVLSYSSRVSRKPIA